MDVSTLVMEWGMEHEERYVREQFPHATRIPDTCDVHAPRATFEAMLRGDRAIQMP